MIRYKLSTKDGEVLVSVDSEQAHKVAPIHYDGDARAVLAVRRWLTYEIGLDGREIGEWCAPSDLKSVMGKNGAGAFKPALLEEKMGGPSKKNSDAEGGG
jgi:hypothetical protein